MNDEMRGEVARDLRHVLNVSKYRVFQAVAGIRSTTAFSGTQIFGEPEIKKNIIIIMLS